MSQAVVELSRSASASDAAPVLDVTHTCPETLPARPPGQSFRLSWSALDTFVSTATDGLSLLSLLPEGTQSSWSALRVRIEPSARPEGPSHFLRLDARGSGPLFSLPLSAQKDGFGIRYAHKDLSLVGTLSVDTAGSMKMSITSGRLGSFSLAPASMTLEAE